MKDHETPFLTETFTDGILTLSLGAAPAHALSLGMIRALQGRLTEIAADESISVVVLVGEGRIFCAGHDLKEIQRHRADPADGRAYVEALLSECGQMMTTLAQLPQPTIAAVEGVATAGGLQLMCSCDLAFAGDTARFCLPGVSNLGFCSTPSVAVGRRLQPNHLLEMALSGEMFDTEWALRTGLVNRVVPAGGALDAAMGFAQLITAGHMPATKLGKATFYKQMAQPLEHAYATATEAMISHFMDPVRVAKDKERY